MGDGIGLIGTREDTQPPAGSAPQVPRTVKGLGLVSLFNDFASEMVYPLLPAFVTRTLGAGPVALGALDGAADLASSLVRWVSGRLADRPGWQKPLILAGYGTAVLVRPLIAIASLAWQVIGFRVLDRVGKGMRTPARDALIAQVTPHRFQGRAFGFHRAADHGGAVAGSVLAWLLVSAAVPVREVIGWSFAPGVLALGILLLVLRASGRRNEGGPERTELDGGGPRESGRARTQSGGGGGPADAEGWGFWAPALALTLLIVGRLPETLLLLRLQDLGLAIALVPLAWAGLHVVRSLASYPGGWLNDRLGPRVIMALGSLLFAGVLAVLGGPLGAAAAVGVFLVLGLVSGLTEGAERATVARLAPVRTGRGFGSFQAVSGVASLPLALLLGAVYQSVSGPAALWGSSLLLGLGVLLWLPVSRRPLQPQQQRVGPP